MTGGREPVRGYFGRDWFSRPGEGILAVLHRL